MQTKFERTVRGLGAQVLGKQRSLPWRTALVRGIYSVAQMIVALDGRILPYEPSAILSLSRTASCAKLARAVARTTISD